MLFESPKQSETKLDIYIIYSASARLRLDTLTVCVNVDPWWGAPFKSYLGRSRLYISGKIYIDIRHSVSSYGTYFKIIILMIIVYIITIVT